MHETAIGIMVPPDDEARAIIERLRWPNGPVCAHCGGANPYRITKKKATAEIRPGLYCCSAKECRKQFTVTVGTIFEDSHIPLGKWLAAIHLMCASQNGIGVHRLHRVLKIRYQTAWHLVRRIRLAMSEPPLVDLLKDAGEIDEAQLETVPKSRYSERRIAAPKIGRIH